MISKIKRALFGEPREYRCVAEEYQFWQQIMGDYAQLAEMHQRSANITLAEYYHTLACYAYSKQCECQTAVIIAYAMCIREATK